MILGKDQKEDVARRIDFIRIQLKDLEQFKGLEWKTYSEDRNLQRNVERLVENVANASIDICKIMLVGEDIELPNSYKEIIFKLGEVRVLTPELAKKVAEYAGLRNFLAHQYLDLRWEKIKAFIKDAPRDFNGFISSLLKKLH